MGVWCTAQHTPNWLFTLSVYTPDYLEPSLCQCGFDLECLLIGRLLFRQSLESVLQSFAQFASRKVADKLPLGVPDNCKVFHRPCYVQIICLLFPFSLMGQDCPGSRLSQSGCRGFL
jgi:hypothetical protein